MLSFGFFAAFAFFLNQLVVLIELALQQSETLLGLNGIWTLWLVILFFIFRFDRAVRTNLRCRGDVLSRV